MYAIKGGWVGQTFALATSSDSGGRKARIRRSKEERKAMVESFIKKYQSTNDGKFPSLNLTHKEVGGSFYTVREIVRDIIQENRVLGPAKFSLEKHNFDGTTSMFLPRSTSVECEDYLFQLGNENPTALNQQVSGNVELNLNGNLTCAENQDLDAGEFVSRTAMEESDRLVCAESIPTENLEDDKEPDFLYSSTDPHGNVSMEPSLHENRQPIEHEVLAAEQLFTGSQTGEFHEELCTKSLVGENLEVRVESGLRISTDLQEKGNLELRYNDDDQRSEHEGLDVGNLVNSSQLDESDEITCVESSLDDEFIYPAEDVILETFSLQPVKDIYTSDLVSNNPRGLCENTEKVESNRAEIGNDDSVLDGVDAFVSGSEPVAQNVVDDQEAASSKGELVICETANNDASNLQEVENLSKGGVITPCHDDPMITSHYNVAPSKTIDHSQKATDDQNGNCTNHLNGAKTGGGDKQVMPGSQNGVQKKDATLKESRATLDRINLESWEGVPRKSLEQEGNPLVAVFRAVVSAFMKFFSE